jgi:hypothetical protein
VLKAHHEAGTHQLVEDGVTLFVVQSAERCRVPGADFIAGRHREQKILQLIETGIDLLSSHEPLLSRC